MTGPTPEEDAPDVIVVGAGGAGAPLAARLSEDPDRRVLLLEAGTDHPTIRSFPPEIRDAGSMAAAMPGHPANWGFQGHMNDRVSFPVARGRIAGGSTALNGTYFIRARREDFDRWVGAGNPAWAWEEVLPYYRQLEDDRTYGDSAVHGAGGPVPVERAPGAPHPVTEAFIAACSELGFPDEPDKNDQLPPGCGPLPVNTANGLRVNMAIAYLDPAVRARPNLTIIGGAFVRRVCFEGTRAVGVEVALGREGRRLQVAPGGEVVLCAGAVKSPHLLLCSGVGPARQLADAGVPVVHDAPGVGANLADHPEVMFNWRPRRPLGGRLRPGSMQTVLNFTATGSPWVGDLEILCIFKPFADLMGNGLVTGALRRPLATARGLSGMSTGSLAREWARRHDVGFPLGLQQEESRGELRLLSADPAVAPDIRYGYLATRFDRARMREVTRTAAALVETRAFSPLLDRYEVPRATLADDDALDDWLGGHLGTAIHMTGTCRMGPAGDEGAVVDQFGRVHGVEGLRVVDTSIFPTVPRRGPAATVVMVAERIAAHMRRRPAPPATPRWPGARGGVTPPPGSATPRS